MNCPYCVSDQIEYRGYEIIAQIGSWSHYKCNDYGIEFKIWSDNSKVE